jgi:hypothetical protein
MSPRPCAVCGKLIECEYGLPGSGYTLACPSCAELVFNEMGLEIEEYRREHWQSMGGEGLCARRNSGIETVRARLKSKVCPQCGEQHP